MEQTPELPAIVVGVDGSAPSILALRWARALAPLLRAHIRAVTYWQFQIAVGTFTPVVWQPVGSRGHGGFQGLLLGAVSATVAEHAKCPVLVAHGTDLPPGLLAAPGQSSMEGGGQPGSSHDLP